VILHENGLLDAATLAEAVREVWREREGLLPPIVLPPFPDSWPDRYQQLAADQDLDARTFSAVVAILKRLWANMTATTQT
jgi:lambda repressor-like predicted transcriptional regulator